MYSTHFAWIVSVFIFICNTDFMLITQTLEWMRAAIPYTHTHTYMHLCNVDGLNGIITFRMHAILIYALHNFLARTLT